MAFRTKKISQMDPKGANLASTDLLEISELVSGSYVTKSITGAEIIASVPASVTAWGTITGTLSSQTDLNTALSGKVPTTRTLTINGTTQDLSADRTFTISTGITIGTTAITSGTVGRVLFQGTGNVVSQSTNLFWDNTNGRLGIGTSTPSTALMMQQDGASFIRMVRNLSTTEFGMFITNVRLGLGSAGGVFSSNNYEFRDSTGTSAFLTINGGNVLINTTTDAGFKLDVNGTARVVNSISVNTGNVNGQGVQIGSDTNSGIFIVSGATQFRQYSSAFEFAGLGTNVFLRTDSTRIQTRANYGISLGTYAASTPEASAILQAVSTTQGFLPPRMTTTQKNAIATPATGLMVYDTTLNLISVYNGTIWISL